MKNNHLNFFYFYAESGSEQHLENNLTRALAICLQQEPLFLFKFLELIIPINKLNGQFHLINEEDEVQIELQQEVSKLEFAEDVYAVSLTVNKLLGDYHQEQAYSNQEPITDMVIRFKDTLIILEVKRSDENCLGQLKGQLAKYKESLKIDIKESSVKLSWKEVLRLADDINNFYSMVKQPAPFLQNFTQFIRSRYPEWDEPVPFSSIPFYKDNAINQIPIYKRIHAVLQKKYGKELIVTNNRVSIPLKENWATEALVDPYKNDNGEYLIIRIYPGNTKGQGWSLFTNPAGLKWSRKQFLEVADKKYQLLIDPYVKFANNYGSYLFNLILNENLKEYAERFERYETFEKLAGRWNKRDASELEELLDELTDRTWRGQIQKQWDNQFINSGRNFINISLGFEIFVLIPYNEVKSLDKSMNETEPLGDFFMKIVETLKAMING